MAAALINLVETSRYPRSGVFRIEGGSRLRALQNVNGGERSTGRRISLKLAACVPATTFLVAIGRAGFWR